MINPRCASLRNRSDGTLYCPHCGLSWDADEEKPKCPCKSNKGKTRSDDRVNFHWTGTDPNPRRVR